MSGHVVVFGEDPLALRIIDELSDAGFSVIGLHSPSDLAGSGFAGAEAVVCADAEDSVNLEIALLARQADPDLRVVARLSNTVLREALADGNGPGAILDVADLAAPSVVEALLGRATHGIDVSGTEFVVSGGVVSDEGTLGDLYGGLAPVAVLRGENSPAPGEVIASPPPEAQVHRGDWAMVIGTAAEMAECGVRTDRPIAAEPRHRSRLTRAGDALRALHNDVHPMFYRLMAAAVALLIGSTLIVHFAYERDDLGWIDALYFATETLTTTGFGDYTFIEEPAWLRLWAVVMMLVGAVGSAFIVAFAADVLLSRRILKSAGVQKASHLRHHHVIVGLGAFGTRVAAMLRASGEDVVVIERDEENRYVAGAAELGVPVIFGDATMTETLQAAHVERARAVAVLTEDDMTNIETAVVAREMLPAQDRRIPIVMRIYDRALGRAVGRRFGFTFVRSTVDLATPWFLGAAMGLEVLGTFSVGQRSFMVGGGIIEPGSRLDGTPLSELSAATRVIAIGRTGMPLRVHPGEGVRLAAGDTVYLVGPFREIMGVLRDGRRAAPDGAAGSAFASR